jgi:hypothetical protein
MYAYYYTCISTDDRERLSVLTDCEALLKLLTVHIR